MRKIFAAFVFLFGLALTVPVVASPIAYQLTFTVESYEPYDLSYGRPVNDIVVTPISVGQKYYARLVVDDADAGTLGPISVKKVLSFYSQIGQSVWDTSMPSNNANDPANPYSPLRYDFSGFRGPCYNDFTEACSYEQFNVWGLGSEFLGFVEENGVVTKLYGGVFGLGDDPFIDLWGNKFGALPMFLINPAVIDWLPELELYNLYTEVGIRGSLSIARVPEPGILALLSLGFIGFAASRRNRRLIQ